MLDTSLTPARLVILALLLFPVFLGALPSKDMLDELLVEGITVDLKDPVYSDGVLRAEHGGIITGPNIRVQAMNMLYTHRAEGEAPVHRLEAEDQLFVVFGTYLFVGERLEYDFLTNEGVLYFGRSSVDPWYFGGDTIFFHADGSLEILNGYLTTSNDINSDWQLRMERIVLTPDHFIKAKNIQFQFVKFPVFWFPAFKTNLDWILDSPVRFRVRSGGKQGLRFGVIYEAITTDNFKAFTRLDYRLNRGPSFGIETDYRSDTGCERFRTINYVARDSSIEEPNERFRYRFEGVYVNHMDDGKLAIDLSYDWLSDKEMPTDYYDKSLKLETAGRTQLKIRRQMDELMITNFFTRVRVNDFQSVKQELPSASCFMHPIQLGESGLILENHVKGGYLDYQYSDDVESIPDYHSSRVEMRHRIYRPFFLGPLTVTPEARGVGIYYGNSPDGDPQYLATGVFGGEAKTVIHRYYNWGKHLLEPYTNYQYVVDPTVNPRQHYIFDIQDGWYRLNTVRWGVRNLLYTNCDELATRVISSDIFAYAFIDNKTMLKTVPKIYGKLLWNTSPRMRNYLDTAWDLERQIVDHFNFRTEWTVSDCLAVATEYRHRSDYSWRKNVPFNFMMESFIPEFELRHSQLSDRRDTFLAQFYYRLQENLAVEFKLRHGWDRRDEPHYTEYQWDMTTTLRSRWKMRVSYQMKEDDHRLAVYITLDLNRPKAYACPPAPICY